MSCPSRKKLVLVSGSPERGSRFGEHVSACPSCEEVLREERAMEDFFREFRDEGAPSPFLWARIAAGMGVSGRPSAALWERAFSPFQKCLAAGLLCLLVAASLFFTTLVSGSSAAVLVRIDRGFNAVMAEVYVAGENPFASGKEVVALDENPFYRRDAGVDQAAADGNPFSKRALGTSHTGR